MYKVKENFQNFSLMLQRDIRNIKVTKVKQCNFFFWKNSVNIGYFISTGDALETFF